MSSDPYKYFRIEAKELVEQLSRGVLDLEQGTAGTDSVARLLRLAHTLKGAAHVVKQASIANLAHQLEDTFGAQSAGRGVSRQEAEAMLRLLDRVAARLAALGSSPPEETEAGVSAASAASGQASDPSPAMESAPAAPDDVFDTVRVDLGQMDLLLEGVAETSVQLGGVKAKLSALEDADNLAALLLNHMAATTAASGNGRATGTRGLSWEKMRGIVEDLHSLLRPLRHSLSTGVEQLERELAQVRDTASQLRLIPASTVFAPLRRTVRDTAQSLGKQVEFETEGGEHRLDAPVLAAVRDALLQLVRNAVVHGMELPAERQAAGKPATGKVFLQVQRRGNRVAFACHDDGRGFDVVALRRAAVARGLLSRNDAESLGPGDIFRLLLRGGISTSASVTELAGRGIGLDVVRETAAKLKAEVVMRTDPGQGSTVEISVPVSLLSLGAIIVESGGVSASLPMDAVEQTMRLSEEEIVRTPDGDSVVFDGKAIPLLSLDRVLSIPTGNALRSQQGAKTRHSAIVVRSGSEYAAIGVDQLLGAATVLLRPIPAFAGVDPVIAGASLDAEGNPQLVLDPAVLVTAAAAQRSAANPAPLPRSPLVLVIDDSLTTRMLEQSILESAGYQVHLATSGEEALEKARAQPYDLFLVDIEMPGMDGFEFVTRTRADSSLAHVPSILVTSRSSSQDKERGKEVGACAYVVKSEFDQGQLLQTIRQLV